jgi:hypothetical protein
MEELYNYLAEQEPRSELEHTIMSPEDWELRRRLFEGRENLNLITPDLFGSRGQILLANYCLRAQLYDLAIQPHGAALPNSDAAVYGQRTSIYTKRVAAYLGLSNAIVRIEGVEGALSNSLGIEMSPNSPLLDFAMFTKKINALLDEEADLPQEPRINEYVFIANVTADTANKLRMQAHYEPLEPLSPSDTQKMHRALGSDALELVGYGWDRDLYDHGGYRGELFARLSIPASRHVFKHDRLTI